MRTAFIKELFELAKQDERIVLIVGDLGFGVVNPFMEQLPRQFLNAGVAEQNMTGMAAGMALSGKIALTYSIANFPTLRCLEQVRNDVCYHNANVKIVSVGGGFTYGAMGATHHALEDLAVMRAMPGLVVVAPGDPVEARAATRAVIAYHGPCYLRLGKAGEPVVHQSPIDFELGKAILKPLDAEAVLAAARETGAIFTIEEHSVLGGLGSAVAEVLAEADGFKVPFKRLGVPTGFSPHIGSQEYMQECHGLTEAGIAKSVTLALRTVISS